MRAALIVNRVLPDLEVNLAAVLDAANAAADAGADLALLPEAALTGLNNDDDPVHDLPLGQPIPGPATEALAQLARERRIWLAGGLLERDGARLYDSAVLLAPGGEIGLKYRRIHPGWHGRRADPAVYGHGTALPAARTPFGTVAFLICGDLFDDGLVQRVRELAPDWLLYPFARAFDDCSHDQERWNREEKPHYAARVRLTGATALMTNYLADASLPGDHSFGGALVVSGDGQVLHEIPLGRAGMLLVDC